MNCLSCNIYLTGKQTKFCSKKCGKKYYRKISKPVVLADYNCPICGKTGTRKAIRAKTVTCGNFKCVQMHKKNCRKKLNKKYRDEGRVFPSISYKKCICLCGNIARASVGICNSCKQKIDKAKKALIKKTKLKIKKLYNKKCIHCSLPFESKYKIAKYCNKKCRRNAEHKKWREKYPEKAKALGRKSYAKYGKVYNKKRYKKNPLASTIRSQIAHTIRGNKFTKAKTWKTFDLLGYSPDELKRHIESKFIFGMRWDNYGKWHVDHIKPIAMHDVSKPEGIKICWALKNLKPRWATTKIADMYGSFEEGNVNKGARYVG